MLGSLRRINLNKIVFVQLNISAIGNKFDFLSDGIAGNVDVFMISKTKINDTFSSAQFFIPGYAPSYRSEL